MLGAWAIAFWHAIARDVASSVATTDEGRPNEGPRRSIYHRQESRACCPNQAQIERSGPAAISRLHMMGTHTSQKELFAFNVDLDRRLNAYVILFCLFLLFCKQYPQRQTGLIIHLEQIRTIANRVMATDGIMLRNSATIIRATASITSVKTGMQNLAEIQTAVSRFMQHQREQLFTLVRRPVGEKF